ncbi:NAD(P)H-dependent oxidoreductase [Rhodococcus sp. G-MC3]|uniref:FMN-dependent NADH-azoreductase n=1 Tax=Rhodococcus sp. G-MC3 TaxID=3046209 RepID=UPI0024BB20EE|nr:NAD(P)H-dependent oxidoreductase [Rhodococcus sp. G-MC3]MDJ0395773.1 NAD(P)H-dependent oxidoreductase [Rhodococcus sp. G-MC3]
MPQLLHLDSSADLDSSVSRSVTALFSDVWHSLGADNSVIYRDLHRTPPPHLPSAAMHWAPHLRTPNEVAPPEAEALQKELIDELVSADVVLIGAPMYNWSIPSTLKAWIDYIHVPGITVPFDSPTRPLEGKPVVVVSSRGNQYGPGTPDFGADHTVAQLQQVLGVALGMEVFVVTVDLTLANRVPAMAPLVPQAANSLADARSAVTGLATRLGAAPAAS